MSPARNQVTDAHTGNRVSFRFILPNGHVSEAVGTLELFDDEANTYMVRKKTGELVRVPVRDVTDGKVVA